MHESKVRLINLARELKALQYGEFILASGQRTNVYFDGRRLTLFPQSLALVTDLIWAKVAPLTIDAIAGPAVSSVPIIGSLMYKAALAGRQLHGGFIRKAAKQHGMQSQLEGALNALSQAKVAVVEDTITTGQSLLDAVTVLQKAGHTVQHAFAVLDRGEDTTATFSQRGIQLHTLLTLADVEAAS